MKKLLLIGSWTILLIIAVWYIMNIEFNDRPNEIIMAVMIFVCLLYVSYTNYKK